MEIKLNKPITIGESVIDKLTLNLDDLDGKSIIEAEKEARMRGDTSPNPLFSSQGLAIVAAKASGLISDDIMRLKAPDFQMVTTVVSNFLYGWVLPTLIQETTSDEQA